MHVRKRLKYDKDIRAKKTLINKKNERYADVKPNRDFFKIDGHPGKKSDLNGNGKNPSLSQEQGARLQNLLDSNGYAKKAAELSLGVQNAFLINPNDFNVRQARARPILSFHHMNNGGNSYGGLVEVTCHLHDDNFISLESMVTTGAVISRVKLHATYVGGGKLSNVQSDGSTLIATVTSLTRFKKSRVVGSFLFNCDVRRSVLVRCAFTGKLIEDQYLIENKPAIAFLAELESAAWKWKEIPMDEDIVGGERVPFARSLF